MEKVIALARVLAGDGAAIALPHLADADGQRAKTDAMPTRPPRAAQAPHASDELRTLLA